MSTRNFGIVMPLMAVLAMSAPAQAAETSAESPVLTTAKAAETRLKARIGFVVHDTGNGQTVSYRAEEAFPMASTFKALACAALLKGGDAVSGKMLTVQQSDLMEYAPVTKDMVGKSASAADFCAITLRTSDNTAANKVLEAVGGPKAVTAFLRSIGDKRTRLDRTEPTLNEGKPGDPRDTTTPAAMAATMEKLVLGQALPEASRATLTQWLIADEVAGPLLRAGLPKDWRIADRTGAGGHGTRGIVSVIWPSHHAPLVAVVYITGTKASMDERNKAIAEIGKAIAETYRN
ncbi:beta-lactamase class A [Rhizobium paknamense]|uniref:Beta-lactamase n=2 Tax=Rhizobium paknamense TaxID=1206817 RepID=A0ABU0I6B2_9HYPH|nr:beta-lactamase class A [Rhizobium paknamense]